MIGYGFKTIKVYWTNILAKSSNFLEQISYINIIVKQHQIMVVYQKEDLLTINSYINSRRIFKSIPPHNLNCCIHIVWCFFIVAGQSKFENKFKFGNQNKHMGNVVSDIILIIFQLRCNRRGSWHSSHWTTYMRIFYAWDQHLELRT